MLSIHRLTDPLARPSALLAGVVVLVAMAPFGNDSSQPLMFLAFRTLLVAITVAGYWSLKGGPSPDLPAAVYLLGAGVLTLMGLAVWRTPGEDPSGWTIWWEHALFGIFFIVYARVAARQSPRWKISLLGSLVGVALAHWVLGQVLGPRPELGLFANSNYFAAYLLVGFGSAVALAMGQAGLWKRVLAGGCALALLYGITDSLSRGATLAALGIVVLAACLYRSRQALAALGILVVVGSVVLSPALVRKFTDRGELDPYNYQRVEIWRSTLEMIADHPGLGVGPGEYEHAARLYRFPVEGEIGRYMKRAGIAHSEYLHYAAESGLPAALMVVCLLAGYLWMLVRAAWRARGGPPFETAGLLVLSGVAAHAIVDNVFQVSVVAAVMAVAGLASTPLVRNRTVPAPSARSAPGLALLGVGLFVASTVLPAMAYQLDALGAARRSEARLEDSVQAYRAAVALRPNDARLLTDLGAAYEARFRSTGDLGLLDTAEAYFLRAAHARPRFLSPRQAYADALVLRLDGTASDGWIEPRLAEANRAILDLDPFLPLVRQNLAEALYRSGRTGEAADELRRAVELEPNFVPGYLKLAEWSEREGDPESGELRERAGAIVEHYAQRQSLTAYEAALLGREGTQ